MIPIPMNCLKRATVAAMIIPLLFVSCKKKVVNPALNIGDDKIFVQCYLNPDVDTITLALSVARGIVDNGKKIGDPSIENAHIVLSSDGVSMPMNFHSWVNEQAVFYLLAAELPVIAGHTYHLNIDDAGNAFHASASTVIPEYGFSFEHSIKGPLYNDNMGAYFDIKTVINDAIGATNFYRATIENIDSSGYSYIYHQNFVNDDEDKANTLITQMDIYQYQYDEPGSFISVSNMRQETYQFLSKLEDVVNNNGNPFAEPAGLPTNINGGLGIFGGITVQSKPLK